MKMKNLLLSMGSLFCLNLVAFNAFGFPGDTQKFACIDPAGKAFAAEFNELEIDDSKKFELAIGTDKFILESVGGAAVLGAPSAYYSEDGQVRVLIFSIENTVAGKRQVQGYLNGDKLSCDIVAETK